MKQGIVIEVKKHYSIVLTDGNYFKIHNKKNMLEGMNVLYTDEDRVGGANSNTRTVPVFRYASVAAALVLVVMMSLMYYNNNLAVYAVVTMDINPSVEVMVNKEDEVLNVKHMNEDGKALLSGFDVDTVIGKPIDEAIAALIALADANDYISDEGDSFVAITTVPMKKVEEGQAERIMIALQGMSFEDPLMAEVNIALLTTDKKVLKKAKEDKNPVAVEAMQSKGKAMEAKTVKDLVENDEVKAELAGEGQFLGSSMEHRQDIQALANRLNKYDVDVTDILGKGWDDLASIDNKESLMDMKRKGKDYMKENGIPDVEDEASDNPGKAKGHDKEKVPDGEEAESEENEKDDTGPNTDKGNNGNNGNTKGK